MALHEANTEGAETGKADEGPAPVNVWRDRDFSKFVVGNAVSEFASQIAYVAIPLTAVVTIHASSFEVGVMRAAEQLPYLAFVLFFGVALDRRRRRNMLVLADISRSALLVLVPIAYALHSLGVPLLIIIAMLAGAATVLFDVGAQAYLPRLVERDQITQAISVMEGWRSASVIAGPAVGGMFVAWFSPPNAVGSCAAFYVLSVVTIWWIRKPEPKPDPAGDDGSAFAKIGEGFRLILKSPVMRSIMIMVSLFNFSYAAFLAIYLVYLPIYLKLPSYAIGLVYAATGPGLLVGATFSSRLPKRFGYGRVMLSAGLIANIFLIGISQVRGNGIMAIGLLILLNFLYGAFSQTFNVSMSSIRQSITSDKLLGRVMATYRFFGVGPVPLGSILGGLLAEAVGLYTALFSVTMVMVLVSVLFLFSALRGIGRELPKPVEVLLTPDEARGQS